MQPDIAKWAGLSKTILGVLLMSLVSLGPLIGLDFTADDSAFISEKWDIVLEGVGAIMGIWGRMDAKTSVFFVKKPSSDSTLNSPAFVSALAILAALLLSACSSFSLGGDVVKLTPQQRLYQFESEVLIAKEEAALYASRPFCSEEVLISCADPDIVIKLDEGFDAIDEYLETARVSVPLLDINSTSGDPLQQGAALLRTISALIVASEAEGLI